jgi:F0F1-type ATP synthase gamma subunit
MRSYTIIKQYTDFWSELNFKHAMEIGEHIISQFVGGDVDQVQVVYNEFISVGKQEVLNAKFLPLTYTSKDDSSLDVYVSGRNLAFNTSCLPTLINSL